MASRGQTPKSKYQVSRRVANPVSIVVKEPTDWIRHTSNRLTDRQGCISGATSASSTPQAPWVTQGAFPFVVREVEHAPDLGRCLERDSAMSSPVAGLREMALESALPAAVAPSARASPTEIAV